MLKHKIIFGLSVAGFIVSAMIANFVFFAAGSAESADIDPQTLQQMQNTIRQQQEQLRIQADLLERLQKQVDAMQQSQSAHQVSSSAPASPLSISSGNEKIKVVISGQVNRAINLAGDGKPRELYSVDNSTSGSRLRVVGTLKIDDDLSLGTKIEVGITPDTTSQVSQRNKTPGIVFDQRWTEISLSSVRYGRLSIGKGDTASNGSAEVDLSRTDAVQYASVSDIASAMIFREKQGRRALTELKVSDVFQDRDGLSRQSRLRYDTPAFHGFNFGVSLVNDKRYDAAVFWGGEWYGGKAAGAFAVSEPNLPDCGLQYDGSFSILHVNSGLNLTLSGGLQKRDRGKDASNIYAKLGWLTNVSDKGYTALGIDYSRSANLPESNDRGYSLGVAAVQALIKYSTELYIQYRVYSLDRKSGPSVSDLTVGTLGARVKF